MPGRDPLITSVRRTAARAAAIVLVAGALVAPATVASAARSGRAVRCPPGTKGAVIDAYATVLSRVSSTAGADQRAALLARGTQPSVRAILDTWLASPVGASSTMTVNDVHCPSRSRAVVDADLVLAGVPLPEVLSPGRAVRDDGTWKVATSTFCERMALEDPALAGAGACARR